MVARLVALPYSPWSERARWSLDHHRLAFRETEYVPLLGEPLLRLLAHDPFGKTSVPLYVEGSTILRDSVDIARFADRVGTAQPLFPAGQEAAIGEWTRRSDALMEAGRALTLSAVEKDPEALAESLPRSFPSRLRAHMTAVGRLGTWFLARKYSAFPGSAARAALREELVALRRGLEADRSFLLGGFTFADIAMSTALQFVRPAELAHIPLGPATRRAFTRPEFAEEFSDLLAWRDRVYEAQRR